MKKAWLFGLALWLGAPALMAAEILPAPTIAPTVTTPAPALTEADFFSTVNETGGYINQDLHHAFWALIAQKYSPEQQAQMVIDIHQALEVLKAYQTQIWESAKLSYFSKQFRLTLEYTPIKARLLQLQSPYFSPQTLVSNGEKIIEAAANRQALDLGAGNYYITPELIEENLIGMRGSYERLKLLMTPDWRQEYREYPLPKLAVTLLNLYAPDEYEESITQDEEKLVLHTAQFSSEPFSLYEVGSLEYQKGQKRFEHFTHQEREAYLQAFVDEQFAGYKVTSPQMSKGLWRGHAYAKGVSAFDDYHVILMCFFMGDKVLYLKHVTDADLANATSHFNDFTKRLQLMEAKGPSSGGSPLRTYTRTAS